MMNKLMRLLFYLTCVLMVMPLLQGTLSISSISNASEEDIIICYGRFFEEKTFMFKVVRYKIANLEDVLLQYSAHSPSSFWIKTKAGWFKLSLHKGQSSYWVQCTDFDYRYVDDDIRYADVCDRRVRMRGALWRYKYFLNVVQNVSICITSEGLIELRDKRRQHCFAKLKRGFF